MTLEHPELTPGSKIKVPKVRKWLLGAIFKGATWCERSFACLFADLHLQSALCHSRFLNIDALTFIYLSGNFNWETTKAIVKKFVDFLQYLSHLWRYYRQLKMSEKFASHSNFYFSFILWQWWIFLENLYERSRNLNTLMHISYYLLAFYKISWYTIMNFLKKCVSLLNK